MTSALPTPAFSTMSRMAAGLRVLDLLAGCLILLACLNLAGYFLDKSSFLSFRDLFLALFLGAFLLLAFVLACRSGILRGYRIAAILVLLVPVFLVLPFVTETMLLYGFALLDVLDPFAILWITIPLRLILLALLVAVWPLAFGAESREWYRQWERTSNDICERIFSFRLPCFLARHFAACFEICLEKGFGKWRSRLRRRQAQIHEAKARALFEAVAALRKREGMPIESVIASYDNIVQRHGQDETPAVRDLVERARQEKEEILRAQAHSS
jgi:hypothetical protein